MLEPIETRTRSAAHDRVADVGAVEVGRVPRASQCLHGKTRSGAILVQLNVGFRSGGAHIRGKTGTIVHVSTPTPFPDAAGHNMQAEIEPTYDVRFRARDLWPDASDEALNHCIPYFKSYLEKVKVRKNSSSSRSWTCASSMHTR